MVFTRLRHQPEIGAEDGRAQLRHESFPSIGLVALVAEVAAEAGACPVQWTHSSARVAQ
jgi:hypothetical protein